MLETFKREIVEHMPNPKRVEKEKLLGWNESNYQPDELLAIIYTLVPILHAKYSLLGIDCMRLTQKNKKNSH